MSKHHRWCDLRDPDHEGDCEAVAENVVIHHEPRPGTPIPAEDAEPLPAGHPDTWPGGTMHMPAQPAAPEPSSAMNSAEDMQAVADEAAARLPQYGDAAKHREVCSIPECHEGCPTCVFAGTDAATNHPPPDTAEDEGRLREALRAVGWWPDLDPEDYEPLAQQLRAALAATPSNPPHPKKET